MDFGEKMLGAFILIVAIGMLSTFTSFILKPLPPQYALSIKPTTTIRPQTRTRTYQEQVLPISPSPTPSTPPSPSFTSQSIPSTLSETTRTQEQRTDEGAPSSPNSTQPTPTLSEPTAIPSPKKEPQLVEVSVRDDCLIRLSGTCLTK